MADQRGRSMRQQPAGHALPGMFFDFINRPRDFSMAAMLEGPRGPLVDAVKSMPALNQAALATAPVPVVGDLVGLAADARMYAREPESRTPGNAALSMLGLLPFIPGMTVFHGTPHRFMPEPDAPLGKFRLDKIGTGEGAQAYGHGIYVAESPDVATGYAQTLAGGTKEQYDDLLRQYKQELASASPDRIVAFDENGAIVEHLEDAFVREMDSMPRGRDVVASTLTKSGRGRVRIGSEVEAAQARVDYLEARPAPNVYSVDLPDEQIAKMLDWDAPLSEQPEMHAAFKRIADEMGHPALAQIVADGRHTGGAAYQAVAGGVGNSDMAMDSKFVSEKLRELGIPGIRYLDGNSRRNMARLPYQEGLPSGWQFFKNKYGIGIKDDKGLIQTDGFASEAAAHRHIFGEKGTRNFVLFDPDVAKIVDRK